MAIVAGIFGSLGTFFEILWIVIKHGPQLWTLIKSIVDMIEQIKDKEIRQAAWNELNEGAYEAYSTGSTTKLEKVFKKHLSTTVKPVVRITPDQV